METVPGWAILGVLLLLFAGRCRVSEASLSTRDGKRPEPADYVGWDDYVAAWEAADSLRASRMYPFSEQFGDAAPLYSGGVSLPVSVKFYAVKYRSLYVSPDGHFRFSSLAVAPPSRYMGDLLPNQRYPEQREEDPALAAIFYAPHKYEKTGSLHYREVRKTAGASAHARIDRGQLEQLSAHVQAAVVGADSFRAAHAVIATWDSMTFEGAHPNIPGQYWTNTYQMVLVTDGADTFIIFNFYNVTWAGSVGGGMGCDPNTGRRSDSFPGCRGPQIGFNVGDGRRFWPSPYSQSLRVVDLDLQENRGSSVRGRFFYKVSDAFILRGGCTADTAIFNDPAWPLATSPTSGGMLGGYDVNISAPCFTSGDRISCHFGDHDITDAVYDGNVMKARCPAPSLSTVGQVTVAVSIDGGVGFPFSTRITVAMPGYVPASVQVQNPTDDWLNVARFQLTWDPRALTWRDVDYVDIRLYGYREAHNQGAATWRLLHEVASGVRNEGYHDVVTGSQQCGAGQDAETDCTQYTMGLFMVALANSNPGASPIALWSDPLPLGWYVRTAAPTFLGTDWAHEMCRFWHSEDGKADSWEDGLPPCPCRLGQAAADWGRFPTDPACNTMNAGSPSNCRRHQGAKHCVISSFTTAQGAGSYCCYDAEGDLLYSGDADDVGTPARAHPWGRPPGSPGTPTAGSVPALSHWFWDRAPFFPCCAWQTDQHDCFNLYIARRTTPSCRPYKPPALAAVFGDPHVVTYDGVAYTYNGKGEYWLLRAAEAAAGGRHVGFTLQARFQQPRPLSWGVPQATALTAVAMQETQGDSAGGATVEIQLNNYAPGDRRLLVYVDGELQDFRQPAPARQDFPEFVITTNDPDSARVHGNFTIIFRASGVGVQVAHQHGLIHVISVIPPQFKGLTEGLFGVWDGKTENDLTPRGGGSAVPPEDTERIHHLVGNSWQVGQSESRFRYWAKLNRDYYQDLSFRPKFRPEFPANGSAGVTEGQVEAACGGDPACTYDYKVTLTEEVALDTLRVQAWTREQADNAQPAATCGWLNIPNAIKGRPLRHAPGSVVHVTACRDGFRLEGATRYTCSADGSARWQPEVSTRCIDVAGERAAQSRLALAIGVPVGVLVLLAIIGVLAALCYLQRRQLYRKHKQNPPDDLMHIPVSQFHASDIRAEETAIPMRGQRPRPNRGRPDATPTPSASGSGSHLQLSRSHNDLYAAPGRVAPRPALSASADNLGDALTSLGAGVGDEPDEGDCDSSMQSGTGGGKPPRPYHYPRNTDTLQERRRAPYQAGYQAGHQTAHQAGSQQLPYRRADVDFTPEERALIEARTREYNT